MKNDNQAVQWETLMEKLANISFDENKGKENNSVWMIAVPSGNFDGYGFYVYFIKKTISNTQQEYKVSDGKYYNYESTHSGFFDGKR